MRILLTLCIGLLLFLQQAVPTFAQDEITITGKVIDDLSQEPIPFANVYLKGTTRGVTSDFDGKFLFKTERLSDTLVVSVVGYKTVEKLLGEQAEQTVNFRIEREDQLLEVFEFSAGENPANIILRKIIKNKPRNNLKKRFSNFKHETYNKLELDIANISEEMRNRRLFKPFQFIFENVDSVSEERPFLPMFLTETISDFYYQKDPTTVKEIIRATKVSGIKDKSVTQFLGNMYQQIDIYKNFLRVGNKSFVSPISNQGLTFYKYSLTDSAYIDNKWCYFITFKPKRKQANAFIGDLWVADTTFAIRRVSMQLNAKNANINFIKKVSVFQEYNLVEDSIWVQKKDKLIVDFIATKNGPSVIGRKTTTFKDHVFNQSETVSTLRQKGDLEVKDDVFEKDESFWQQNRHEELSANEQKVYAMVDTLKNMPLVKTYIDIVQTVISGYKKMGKFKVGPYFKLMSYNEVEGIRTRLGIRTNTKFSERLSLGVYGAYGFRDEGFKYGGDALYVLSSKPFQTVSLAYYDDLDLQAESQEEFSQDNFLIGFIRNRSIPQKLIREKSIAFNYKSIWGISGWSTDFSLRHKRMNPYFDYYFYNERNDDRALVDAIPDSTMNTMEVGLKLRYAHKEKFIEGKFRKVGLGSKMPVVHIDYRLGLQGILGSDFKYQKLEIGIFDKLPVGTLGYTEYIISAGKVFGTLPFPLLEKHPGNETYFFNKYAFNRMLDYEFISDTYATLFLTHHFDGFFLNRFPLLRKLKMRSLISTKILVGSLSQENIAANSNPTDEEGQYRQFNDMIDDWQIQSADTTEPYVEVAVGIENILRLIRIDAVWRLTHIDKEKRGRPGIRTGIQVKF